MAHDLMSYLRHERNIKLQGCDWTQSTDSALSDKKKTEWATYRQELRDMISSASPEEDLNEPNCLKKSSIIWPTKPE
jgi:hypothetical protein